MNCFARIHALVVIASLMASGLVVAATELSSEKAIAGDKTQGLSPAQREQIQHIGQAVLLAKRSAKPSPDLIKLRAQVDQLRHAAENLAALGPSVPLRLANGTTSTTANTPALNGWRQTRAADIATLHQAATSLRQHSRTARHTSTIPFGNSDAMNSLYGALPSATADAVAGNDNIVTTVAAQNRIEHLETDIDAALALPDAERQTRLNALAQEFHLHKHPQENADATKVADVPTFVARTQHRRDMH